MPVFCCGKKISLRNMFREIQLVWIRLPSRRDKLNSIFSVSLLLQTVSATTNKWTIHLMHTSTLRGFSSLHVPCVLTLRCCHSSVVFRSPRLNDSGRERKTHRYGRIFFPRWVLDLKFTTFFSRWMLMNDLRREVSGQFLIATLKHFQLISWYTSFTLV